MMMAGTQNDAQLMVELAKLAAMNGLSDAVGTILSDEFDPETANAHDPAVRTVLNFNETVATLVSNDLLNRHLVQDWLWVSGTWARVSPAALRLREKTGASALYANYESLATDQVATSED
jgi:hypothetical protein